MTQEQAQAEAQRLLGPKGEARDRTGDKLPPTFRFSFGRTHDGIFIVLGHGDSFEDALADLQATLSDGYNE